MNDIKQYDFENVHALVVVSAKEHGKVYTLQNGELTIATYTAEHPPTHSDDEGFFMRQGAGEFYGAGYAKETDDKINLDRYIKAIAGELSDLVSEHQPEVILVLEPEHLKGQIENNLINPKHVPVLVVTYGNYVEKEPQEIADLVRSACSSTTDPADPASVAGEENAEEKRKILEVGKQVSG